MSADNFNAFKSNNYPELARIGLAITFLEKNLHRSCDDEKLKVHTALDTDVIFIELYPGLSEQTLRHMLNTPHIKGVVLKTYGAGNAPNEPWFIGAVSEAVNRGLVVLNVTQCANGGVNNTLYETGNSLAAAGVVSGHDMTSEAAITKLMYLFGQGLSGDEVRRALLTDMRGEVTVAGKGRN